VLAKRLATELHQYKNQEGFGFNVPTFCGMTKQKNGWYRTWEHCYNSLIGTLLEGLAEHGYDDLVRTGEEVQGQYVNSLPGIDSIKLTHTRVIPKLLGIMSPKTVNV